MTELRSVFALIREKPDDPKLHELGILLRQAFFGAQEANTWLLQTSGGCTATRHEAINQGDMEEVFQELHQLITVRNRRT